MKATIVSYLPKDPSRDKEEGLAFQEERKSFNTEIILYYGGVLFLCGYDYKVNYEQEVTLLVGCFEQGSNIEEVLKEHNVLKPWEKLYGILTTIGNIPILVTRYDNDVENIMNYLEKQTTIDSQTL